jgi:hypothetical protein
MVVVVTWGRELFGIVIEAICASLFNIEWIMEGDCFLFRGLLNV